MAKTIAGHERPTPIYAIKCQTDPERDTATNKSRARSSLHSSDQVDEQDKGLRGETADGDRHARLQYERDEDRHEEPVVVELPASTEMAGRRHARERLLPRIRIPPLISKVN